MNRGVFQSSPVQQAVAGAAVGWWSLAAATAHENPSSFLQLPLVSSPLAPWADTHEQPSAESWSHLQLLCAEEEMRCGSFNALLQPRKVENWEDQQLVFQQPTSRGLMVEVKQEGSENSGGYGYRTAATEWSHHQLLPPASRAASPASCTSSFNASMLDFSATKPADAGSREQKPEHTHECNSAATGTAAKKPRLQQGSSASQSTFKVRKEKLGDRITALHQLVSPFGKTDTASVLLEAIGYIRFLQNQIEALSSPYLGTAPSATRLSSSGQGERGCIFPEDPGQLLNDACMKRQGASDMDQMDAERERKKDLRSRGLCLVPVSCTMHMGSDNGADFWAPAIGGGVFR